MVILQNFKVNLVKFVMLNKLVKKSTNYRNSCSTKPRAQLSKRAKKSVTKEIIEKRILFRNLKIL